MSVPSYVLMNPEPLFEEDVRGGGLWSGILRRHTTLRITDLEGGTNVGFMCYNADAPLDRLNLPDTLKAQYTAKLTRGHVLMSDMGRALLSITADTCGWHDPLGGHNNVELVRAKYGERSYQQARNDWYRNAHDNFLVELGKHGLGKRDLVANVNFFSRLDADEKGRLTFRPGNSRAGAHVDLRAEMNVLVVINTCQHPLDPSSTYAPKAVRLTHVKTPAPGPDDECRNLRPENGRAFTLTERLFVGVQP